MPELTRFTGDPSAPAHDPITFDVTLRITVSPDSWDLDFGTGTLPEAVRDDVREWVRNHVLDGGLADEDRGPIRGAELVDDALRTALRSRLGGLDQILAEADLDTTYQRGSFQERAEWMLDRMLGASQ